MKVLILLITLVVSVDVKHHVYLLTRDGTYLLPGADPPVYVRAASTLYCLHSFISRLPCQTFRMVLTASMDRRHGDKECLFGGRITSYGRVWRNCAGKPSLERGLQKHQKVQTASCVRLSKFLPIMFGDRVVGTSMDIVIYKMFFVMKSCMCKEGKWHTCRRCYNCSACFLMEFSKRSFTL